MDPLSVAASIIATIQLTGKVSSILWELRSSVKGAKGDIAKLIDEINSLRTVLEGLVKVFEGVEKHSQLFLATYKAVSGPNGVVTVCHAELAALETSLRPTDKKGQKHDLKAFQWPYKEKGAMRRIDAITRIKSTLQLALATDNISLGVESWKETVALNEKIELSQIENEKREILNWLAAPDPSVDFNNAHSKCTRDTGNWFLKSAPFERWKTVPRSSLWIRGTPGCGKTILCSSIIAHVKQCYQSQPDVFVVYFFFDFTDQDKQTADKCFRSLISQILRRNDLSLDILRALYSQHSNGSTQVSLKNLLKTLKTLLSGVGKTVLILDALDEATERHELLNFVSEIIGWGLDDFYVLITSRDEKDFSDVLDTLVTEKICVQEDVVDGDIRTYVSEAVTKNPRLRKWSSTIQNEIIVRLSNHSDGMFRWAACQLDAIEKCVKLEQLRKNLGSLPRNMEETYARILARIPEEYEQDARKVLQWLCFAKRPLTVEELNEVLAVDLESSQYDPDQKLMDPEEISLICSSLISVSDAGQDRIVKLAHHSVKDYLMSERIRVTSHAAYHVSEELANTCITHTCLAYLLNQQKYNNKDGLLGIASGEFPLTEYATENWSRHFCKVDHVPKLLSMAVEMLDKLKTRCFPHHSPASIGATPLHLAVAVGSPALVAAILDRGVDINADTTYHGTALAQAVQFGHSECVELLLEKGADINLRSGFVGATAIHHAVLLEEDEIAKLLLLRGADANVASVHGDAVLLCAIKNADGDLVRLLLDAGVNANAGPNICSYPLRNASRNGYTSIVAMLIDKGADVNAHGSMALQVALLHGHQDTANLLIERGAKVHSRGSSCGSLGCPLTAAAAAIDDTQISFLVDVHGADVKYVDEQGRSALHIAALKNNVSGVEYLLDLGLHVSHPDKRGWTSIHYAALSKGSSTDTLDLLLPKLTTPSKSSGSHDWTPLHLACCSKGPKALDLLLNAGFQPTPIETEFPSRTWSLYDIAVLFQNSRLVTIDGEPLHEVLSLGADALGSTRAKIYPSSNKICDGCGQYILGPVFHCRTCPDFDYCVICRSSADLSHPHSLWQMLPPEETTVVLGRKRRLASNGSGEASDEAVYKKQA